MSHSLYPDHVPEWFTLPRYGQRGTGATSRGTRGTRRRGGRHGHGGHGQSLRLTHLDGEKTVFTSDLMGFYGILQWLNGIYPLVNIQKAIGFTHEKEIFHSFVNTYQRVTITELDYHEILPSIYGIYIGFYWFYDHMMGFDRILTSLNGIYIMRYHHLMEI